MSITGGCGGYEDTALMVAEAALCLALQRNALPRKQGGVLTPAVAMGSALVERLQVAGLRFVEVPGPEAMRVRL